jgi:hypothetical protein
VCLGILLKIVTHYCNKYTAYKGLMLSQLILMTYGTLLIEYGSICLRVWHHWYIDQLTVFHWWSWNVSLMCHLRHDVWSTSMRFSWEEWVFIMSVTAECQRSFRHALPELRILRKSIICHVVSHTYETGSIDNKKGSYLPSPCTNKTLIDVHLH